MTLYAFGEYEPKFTDKASCWIAPDAAIIGNVSIGENVGIWFGSAIRGDNDLISIGTNSNIQEHCVMHTDTGFPLTIGNSCTIGHKALLHGCTIGDNSMVGMGAIILNGAKIGKNCLVGAGALVTEGKEFPDNSLILGSPAKVVRTIDSADMLRSSANHYVQNQRKFSTQLRIVE